MKLSISPGFGSGFFCARFGHTGAFLSFYILLGVIRLQSSINDFFNGLICVTVGVECTSDFCNVIWIQILNGLKNGRQFCCAIAFHGLVIEESNFVIDKSGAKDAVILDTTGNSIEESAVAIKNIVKEKLGL